MLKPANVATPPAAATVVVPDSAPPPGFVPSATVTFAANWVAVFPCASCAVTCTAGVIGAPAVVLDGWTLDRKSTRLNSSHSQISYAVFCLKKKTPNDGTKRNCQWP